MAETPHVYKAIVAVQDALAREGIAKARTNQQQGFKYRGIDECYAALAPLLAANNLCILPRMTGKDASERVSGSGKPLFYTTITAEFDLVSSVDGSKHTVSAYGEAMDSADKSIGKAMSYAYKAMAFQTFCIPTEGDNDPDATAHDVAPRAPHPKPAAPGEPTTGGTLPSAPARAGQIPIPTCPECKGPMWDNRDKRAQAEAEIAAGTRELNAAGKPKAAPPAWKCKDRACKGMYWPADWREPQGAGKPAARPTPTAPPSTPKPQEPSDDLPPGIPLDDTAPASDEQCKLVDALWGKVQWEDKYFWDLLEELHPGAQKHRDLTHGEMKKLLAQMVAASNGK